MGERPLERSGMMKERRSIDDRGIDQASNDAAALAMLRPDASRRSGEGVLPAIDPSTGDVSGSGAGPGGGNAGEDFDGDHTAGSNTTR